VVSKIFEQKKSSINMSEQIDGVSFVPRRIIPSAQGEVKHLLKNTDPEFSTESLPFGEAYLSILYPGFRKDWKLHTKCLQRLYVLVGMVEFAMYDARENSPTYGKFQREMIGVDRHGILIIPPGVIATWRNVTEGNTMILNLATLPHDPEESKIIPFEEIPFQWDE